MDRAERALKGHATGTVAASGADKRQSRRVFITQNEVPLWKYAKFSHASRTFVGFIKNISSGGFFLETEVQLPVNEQVDFEFAAPDRREFIVGVARVVWNEVPCGDRADEPNGMGLEFVELRERGRELLAEYIGAEPAQSGRRTQN